MIYILYNNFKFSSLFIYSRVNCAFCFALNVYQFYTYKSRSEQCFDDIDIKLSSGFAVVMYLRYLDVIKLIFYLTGVFLLSISSNGIITKQFVFFSFGCGCSGCGEGGRFRLSWSWCCWTASAAAAAAAGISNLQGRPRAKCRRRTNSAYNPCGAYGGRRGTGVSPALLEGFLTFPFLCLLCREQTCSANLSKRIYKIKPFTLKVYQFLKRYFG